MEIFLLDYIVNNVIHTKKKISKQLSSLENICQNAFALEITSDKILARTETIKRYQSVLQNIMRIPKVEQRSEEWYNIRQQLITASDFAQALGKGKFGTTSQFYKNKCGYDDTKLDFSIPALQWGVRYEEVANMFYKKKMNVNVHEFGILRHPNIDYIGASPDGISDMGIMLEIKCPWKRKKTETIPEQYYHQIQGQLEVCNLEECDYLECYIVEYETYEDMRDDPTVLYKGVVYEMFDGSYQYGNLNDLDYTIIIEYKKVFYYGIRDYFLKRVFRDRTFFNEIISDLEKVWNNVKLFRTNKVEYDKIVKTSTSKRKQQPVFMFRQCEDDKIGI